MDVKLPRLAEGVDSGIVVSILVSEGQEIKKDQPFIELETQKAVGSIPSPESGTVSKIHVKEGMEVAVGQLLISISTDKDSAVAKPATGEQAGAPTAVERPAQTRSRQRRRRARRLNSRHKRRITGTNPKAAQRRPPPRRFAKSPVISVST